MAVATRTLIRITVPAHPAAEADFARAAARDRRPNYQGDVSNYNIWRNDADTAWILSAGPGAGVAAGDVWWRKNPGAIPGTFAAQGAATEDAEATDVSAPEFDLPNGTAFPQQKHEDPDTGNDAGANIREAPVKPARSDLQLQIVDAFRKIKSDFHFLPPPEYNDWWWYSHSAVGTRKDPDGTHFLWIQAGIIHAEMTSHLTGGGWIPGQQFPGGDIIGPPTSLQYDSATNRLTYTFGLNADPEDPDKFGVYLAQVRPDRNAEATYYKNTSHIADRHGWPTAQGTYQLSGTPHWPMTPDGKWAILATFYHSLGIYWRHVTAP